MMMPPVIVSLLLVLAGALLAGAVLGRHCRRLQRRLREHVPAQALQDSETQARARLDGLQQQLEQLQAELDSAQQHGQRQLQALASEQQLRLGHQEARQGQARQQIASQCGTLEGSIGELLQVGKTYERWHASLDVLLAHNRAMHDKNDEFASIVRQLIIVALNASIEAARAGAMGRGFAVVAEEMRSLSVSAEKLAQDFRSGLYENDLITTTTFQDMQAGGKMVVGALTGLELQTRRMLGQLQAPEGGA